MLVVTVALLMQAAVPGPASPSPEASRLARELAEAGVLATLLPTMMQKDLEDLAAERPRLTPDQKRQLVATGQAIAAEKREVLLGALAATYARRLSEADLRILVATSRTPAARAKRAADLPAAAAAMTAIGSFDLKRETATRFCTETKLFCDR